MSKPHIKELGDLLSREAEKQGYAAIDERLRSCLGKIAAEKNSHRFARLANDLKTFYGEEEIGDDLAEWVTEAFRLRGKAAHRPIIGASEAERIRMYMAIGAECFAYLMLLRKLPMAMRVKPGWRTLLLSDSTQITSKVDFPTKLSNVQRLLPAEIFACRPSACASPVPMTEPASERALWGEKTRTRPNRTGRSCYMGVTKNN